MKIFSLFNITAFLLLASFLVSGCSAQNNSKQFTKASGYPAIIEKAVKDKRYFIMYSGIDTFTISSLLLENSKQDITVHLNKLDSLHRITLSTPRLLSEKQLHLYVKDSASYTLDEPHTIPLSKVSRIELID